MVALDQPVMTDEQVGCSTRNAPALCSLSRSLGGTGQEGRKKKKHCGSTLTSRESQEFLLICLLRTTSTLAFLNGSVQLHSWPCQNTVSISDFALD